MTVRAWSAAHHWKWATVSALLAARGIQPLHSAVRSAALRKVHQLHQLHRIAAADRCRAGACQRVAEGGVALPIVARQIIGLMGVDAPFVIDAGERARQRVHAPADRAGATAGAQLVFLRIQAVLEVTAARAMHGEAQAAIATSDPACRITRSRG